jgi:hypothetical protein
MRLSTLIVTLIFLLPICVGSGLNQLNPSMQTALGVAYFGALGLALGVLATVILLLLNWRGVLQAPNFWVVAISFVISLILFLAANSGGLSAVAS